MPALLAMIMMCSSCRSSSSSDCSSAEALPQWVRSTNSATRCCTLADGRNATTAYGVVPAVNELVVSEGWQVVGFALQQHMFCDIALRPRRGFRVDPKVT